MISMTCTCGGDFWVRDRLAGQTTQCPTCKATLAIPSMVVVETRMTPARCSCGEVFWAAAWRPGRRTKCPVCGRAVGGPGPTTSATVSITAQPSRSAEALPVGAAKPVATPVTPTSAEFLQDRIRSNWPTVVGALVVLSTLGAFALMLWKGGATTEIDSPGVSSTGVTSTGTNPPPPTPPPMDPQRLEPAKVVPSSPTAVLPEAFRSARLRLIVPAYFYPAGPGLEHWERLIAAADRVPIAAVVNPSSGPGDEPNPDYASVIRRADQAGILTVGYVNTGYAERPATQVKDDIDRWLRFYPEIDGIFLDAQASAETHVDYYEDMFAYIRSKIESALVVSNPGTRCDPAYFTRPTATTVVMFENYQGFDAFRIPNALAGYEPLRFAAMPYAITSVSEMRNRIQESVLKGIGSLYLTDAGQVGDPETATNPWGRLPTYWDDEVAAVSRVNQRLAP